MHISKISRNESFGIKDIENRHENAIKDVNSAQKHNFHFNIWAITLFLLIAELKRSIIKELNA